MGAASAILTLLFCTAAETNLLSNPGFEIANESTPTGWHRYVAVQPGALGRIDSEAHRGESAILLHTPLPYEAEPVNNWSQNVYTQLSGKSCEVGGFIRTVDATHAALWVQCWKNGARLPSATYTTHGTTPLQGTQDWQEVKLDFTVPPNTDFLTLRCVIIGTGSVWFDDLYLREATTKKEDSPETTETADTKKPEAPKTAPPDPGNIEALRAEIEKLKQAHYVLAGAVDEMRRTLREQARRYREENAALRQELEALRQTATEATP